MIPDAQNTVKVVSESNERRADIGCKGNPPKTAVLNGSTDEDPQQFKRKKKTTNECSG